MCARARFVLLVTLAALASCLLLLGCASAAPGEAAWPCGAQQQLWLASYTALVRRADLGDADAARQALEMRAHGPLVYGIRFEATPDQLQRWREQSLRALAPSLSNLG
jgi:hypothetical protein